ncbi:MAG: alanine--tRNA ligase [Candidatus Omnitrophica bacterium]|nr:alanine--tRNA ligase [Candidatus Omnitrophota bacterium]
MQADILRKKFLDFFKAKKHKIIESDSLAPKDDPTVLFTPAGMNQFKKEFLGFDSGFKRAATSQRCLRTDDLEKVGKTIGHHTFFEMLGNFSFGDYFKEEAIGWAWEFLTKELKIDESKLWVSVYKDDDEAYRIWRDSIKIPVNKIIKLGDKDNFWPQEAKEKGPNGPCGPCSEIFYDFGSNVGCKKTTCDPSCSCGRFVEVWNLVFTQFNRKESGLLEPLPNKNIDTGMGLERLTAVIEGVQNNFETDLFKPLTKEIAAHVENKNRKDLIYAISDHIRAVTFSIYDGILPSNESRGYVVRKMIRKSLLHLRSLGQKEPFLYKLVPVVVQIMKEPYPDLAKRKENIADIILSEEKNFINTLNSSSTLFKEKFSVLPKEGNPELAGKISFVLHDTYGIPFELTKDWLEKHKIQVSVESFNKELEGQKTRSKSQSSMKGDVFDLKGLDSDIKETKFVGYKEYSTKAKILRIIKNNTQVKAISSGEEAQIILDTTSFYAESGGQIGDTGLIIKGKNIFEVTDTQKSGKVVIHIGKVKSGSFKKSDSITADVDIERRLSIARNHTATHLLQAALRKVLGTHVQQQGSLVDNIKFRFDFTHFKNINNDELSRIEEVVNGYVLSNLSLETKQLLLKEAKKTGALAFFGEKYEGKVRVVSVDKVSKEFCGGTHLNATGQIGLFKIISEGSIASGIRRIEATTGINAYRIIKNEESYLKDICSSLNTSVESAAVETQKKVDKIKELEKQINSQKMDNLKSSIDSLANEAEDLNGVKVITKIIDNLDMNLLRKNVDLIKEKTNNSIIVLGSGSSDKAFLVIGVTPDLCEKGFDASIFIKEAAKEIGGNGGGRKDFAQAGGNNPAGLQLVFEKIKTLVKEYKK